MARPPKLRLIGSPAALALAGQEPPDPPDGSEPPGEPFLIGTYGPLVGQRYTIEDREMTIGRAKTSDICVEQASVSRTHATIGKEERGVAVRDQGSENGLFVNDKRVEGAFLGDGDLIKIGRSIFKFIEDSDVASSYHEEIYRLATIDGLTETFNKRFFWEMLEREVARSREHASPLSLVVLDLDHFRRCNDTHGAQAGDRVLRHVAAIVRDQVRDRVADQGGEDAGSEGVVARVGGEEFAVLLPGVNLDTASGIAEALRSKVSGQPLILDGDMITMAISLGVACWEETMAAPDELTARADARLAAAKQGGRNRVVSRDEP